MRMEKSVRRVCPRVGTFSKRREMWGIIPTLRGGYPLLQRFGEEE
jgi:hypothetical protein